MRAVVATEVGEPDVLRVEERDPPDPGASEVRIEVDAAGVNFMDVECRRGTYPDGPTPPFVPGLEVAGTVTAVGADADRAEGDRVVALTDFGGYATAATARSDLVLPIPEGLSPREAVGFPVQGLTAHNALHEWGGLEAGERVLVHAGAGGVGSMAVQLADHAGAEVFATASTADKLDLARELGADHAIDYETADVADEIAESTDGEGVDLVLDGVGGRAFSASVEALAPMGRIVSYGMASGSTPTVATPRLLFENQSVLGYHLRHALTHAPDRVRAAIPRLTDLLESGDVEVVLGETFPLSAAADAHSHVEERRSTGKVVLEP